MGVELEILKRIFTPEEAEIACRLGREMESYIDISDKIGLDPEIAKEKLSSMTKKTMLLTTVKDETPHYRLAPWIIGIYEAQLRSMDHEFAHLVDKADGTIDGLPPGVSAEAVRTGIVAKAQTEAAGINRKAREEAASEKERAAGAIRDEISALSVELATRATAGAVDEDAHRVLVDRYIEELDGME